VKLSNLCPADEPLLRLVYEHFRERPHEFEQFAADLMRMSNPNVDRIDVTRPWRDGGRDAVGDYLLGPAADPVAVEFALEAKCYAPGNGVGVRETSRLISRLRYRQFGVLVTTSHLDGQAYKEIREDGHPVVVLAGRDITDILKKSGLDSPAAPPPPPARQLPTSSETLKIWCRKGHRAYAACLPAVWRPGLPRRLL
jgi:Restriction endonuclease